MTVVCPVCVAKVDQVSVLGSGPTVSGPNVCQEKGLLLQGGWFSFHLIFSCLLLCD